MNEVQLLVRPLALLVLLFEVVLFGNWLLMECLHLGTLGGLVVALGWAVYFLVLLVMVLLPLAWHGLRRKGGDQ